MKPDSLPVNTCRACGEPVDPRRWALNIHLCMPCGEQQAKHTRHTIVPMPKSNYIVVTDISLLVGLNSSHKGVRS